MRFSGWSVEALLNLSRFHAPNPPSKHEIGPYCGIGNRSVEIAYRFVRSRAMAAIQGYCMKCKTYGPIMQGKKIAMANGRTRMAGFCSQPGCGGKISKIIA